MSKLSLAEEKRIQAEKDAAQCAKDVEAIRRDIRPAPSRLPPEIGSLESVREGIAHSWEKMRHLIPGAAKMESTLNKALDKLSEKLDDPECDPIAAIKGVVKIFEWQCRMAETLITAHAKLEEKPAQNNFQFNVSTGGHRVNPMREAPSSSRAKKSERSSTSPEAAPESAPPSPPQASSA